MKSEVRYTGLGRRKSSTARVTLYPGKHEIKINNTNIEKYLTSNNLIKDVIQPLKITNTTDKFKINANVRGGGISGQAGAIRLGIARALIKVNSDFKSVLKENKMLTRDARVVERKKPGLKKARRKKQFSKR